MLGRSPQATVRVFRILGHSPKATMNDAMYRSACSLLEHRLPDRTQLRIGRVVRKTTYKYLLELKWKGSKSRAIGKNYQLLYHSVSTSRNGVGIILSTDFKGTVISVARISDIIISVKPAMDNNQPCLNVISAYAPP